MSKQTKLTLILFCLFVILFVMLGCVDVPHFGDLMGLADVMDAASQVP